MSDAVRHRVTGKRVCFLNMPIEFYSPSTGGAISTIIAEMSRGLEARGHEITVITRSDGTASHPFGTVIPLGPCGREDLHFFQRRLSALRGRLDQWDWPYFDYYRREVIRAARRLPATPEVVVIFNDFHSAGFLRKLFPAAEICVWLQNEQRTHRRDLSADIDATTCWLTCSGYIREWTLARYSFDAARVVVVASGVNLEQFHPRVGYDDPVETLRVLFVGRIDPNKGPDIAVDAVAALRAEGRAVSMTVAGGKWFYRRGDDGADPYVRALREKMKIAQADDLGYIPRDRIGEVYRRHDVVCVLSRSNEPFGLVTLEAMASGCAVIASIRGGLPEACGGAAELVDPDNPLATQAILRRYLDDPRELMEAKRRAYSHSRTVSWEASVDRFEAAIDRPDK